MPTEPKLEQYLTALDRALGQIPVSDRSDIVTEIKSHILEAKDRDPEQDIGKILASIGEPESVANRYLLERGLKPGRPSKSPIVKWLTVGFLGTFAITAAFILAILWKFTPILKIDEKTGHVVILGGLIDVNDPDGAFELKTGKHMTLFSGSTPVDKASVDRIRISFKSGKMVFTPSKDSSFSWNCKLEQPKTGAPTKLENRALDLNLGESGGAKCNFKMPSDIGMKIEGVNGKVSFVRPRSDVEANLVNGQIGIDPDKKEKYRFDFEVKNGMVDNFTSSDAKNARKIKIAVLNGKITNSGDSDDDEDSE